MPEAKIVTYNFGLAVRYCVGYLNQRHFLLTGKASKVLSLDAAPPQSYEFTSIGQRDNKQEFNAIIGIGSGNLDI